MNAAARSKRAPRGRAAVRRPSSPLLLTSRGGGLLALAAVVCGIWAVVRLRDLLALVALAVAAVLVSVLSLLLIRWRGGTRATVEVDAVAPMVGDPVTATAVVKQRLPFRQSAELVWRGPEGSRATTVEVPARGESRVVSEWRATRRGVSVIEAAELVLMDPLGLARLRVPLRARAELLVLPALLPPESVPSGIGGAESARAALAGASAAIGNRPRDAGDADGRLREYLPGDSPRRVHWKQSARQDRLLVSVPEQGGGEALAIVLVLDSVAYRGAAEFEHAVSLAATLVLRGDGHGAARASTALYTVRPGPTAGAGPSGGAPVIERAAAARSAALRVLALAELANAETASAPAHRARPLVVPASVIITGRITPDVAALAARSAAGTVISVTSTAAASSVATDSPGPADPPGVIDPESRTAIPSGWTIVRAQMPALEHAP
ncbi:DUF58 domain-containing protein [Leucobacter tenebrionis]|uniref:DUF58 domain-containing protein n=1 Tax=Leucobacter tenebrionis TaxID=2873270 RepID=UPI001CA6915C|nr:DUF58 domain-containing protein [Leucobacter tenebrionis]QZY52578.1 DUF58 domain-containing protein [Leucobacter tenebrionis]